ncbi:putative vomeronasal receptor-like protein 4 [Hippopotamus amphibius kiboko]|uniref:putative vomeronasal receptor-like protein 4 n=1 Tax=Hippopotamus amphibius kiboko TaxID=575201 RepID=UPI0025978E17|nr:putative vomeronasal receptor-like protein 4 [Hippopotamus amphibius kiboko]
MCEDPQKSLEPVRDSLQRLCLVSFSQLYLPRERKTQSGGVSANARLLLFHIFTLLLDCRPKPSDLISCHLALIHIVMLLTSLFVSSPHLFKSLNFQNDVHCKAFFFVNRVMRGLSICTTCLLSMFQAITISPRSSWLAQFKQKFMSCIIHVFFFLWAFNLSLSSDLIFYTISSSNVTKTNSLKVSKYCSLSYMNFIIRGLFFTLNLLRDASFVGIMLLSSVYMVILLFRHQRRSQYLHSSSPSPRSSAEKRAIQTILMLVIFFVVMYWVNLISSSSILLWAYDADLLSVQMLVLNAYTTVSPLLLISSDKRDPWCFAAARDAGSTTWGTGMGSSATSGIP